MGTLYLWSSEMPDHEHSRSIRRRLCRREPRPIHSCQHLCLLYLMPFSGFPALPHHVHSQPSSMLRTLSPTLNFETSSPFSTISPTNSWPQMKSGGHLRCLGRSAGRCRRGLWRRPSGLHRWAFGSSGKGGLLRRPDFFCQYFRLSNCRPAVMFCLEVALEHDCSHHLGWCEAHVCGGVESLARCVR